jgi:hypothetical protein
MTTLNGLLGIGLNLVVVVSYLLFSAMGQFDPSVLTTACILFKRCTNRMARTAGGRVAANNLRSSSYRDSLAASSSMGNVLN